MSPGGQYSGCYSLRDGLKVGMIFLLPVPSSFGSQKFKAMNGFCRRTQVFNCFLGTLPECSCYGNCRYLKKKLYRYKKLARIFSKCVLWVSFEEHFFLLVFFFPKGKVRSATLGLLPGVKLGAGSWGERQHCLPLPLFLPPPPHWGCRVSWATAGRKRGGRGGEGAFPAAKPWWDSPWERGKWARL